MPELNENIKLQEIQKLEKELAEKRAAIESVGIENKEAEITEENLKEKQSQAISTQQTTIAITDDQEKIEEIKNDAKGIKNLDTARQVKVPITLAFEKGLTHSIKVARNLNDAYLLDELHDKLMGELRSELVEKGKLKDI